MLLGGVPMPTAKMGAVEQERQGTRRRRRGKGEGGRGRGRGGGGGLGPHSPGEEPTPAARNCPRMRLCSLSASARRSW